MPLISTPDGRYQFAIETPGEGDGNSFIIDAKSGAVIWDRFSYEAGLGTIDPPPAPGPLVPPPTTSPQALITSHTGRVIRVTDESDGDFINRGYSYWSQAIIIGDAAFVFAGHASGLPRFFSVNLATGAVQRLGALVPYPGTGEGWYWSDGWVYLCDGPRLRRINPFSGEDWIVFDVSIQFPDCRIWQAHSSEDGGTHSATLQRMVDDGPYPNIGTVVYRSGAISYFPAQGTLDESQITPDGGWLIIKENDDNRIVTLATGEIRTLTNAQGAIGHSDCGPACVVGEDDQRGACVRLDLNDLSRRVLFETWNMGHVSVRRGRCLLSDAMNISLVALDGSGLTTLVQHGMVGNGYDFQCMANLDPPGRLACWLSNAAGRMDIYLMEIP